MAVGSGYGESKWVSERLLEIVASETSLDPIVVRVGQISGGPNGFWNENEWFPSMVRSSITMKVFPEGHQVSSPVVIHMYQYPNPLM